MIDFKVGIAQRDITPPLGTLLYGYPSERHAQKLLDKIKVSAVTISQCENTLLLISAEICELKLDKCRYITEKLALETGINKENIIYSCSHTHSAPITSTTAGWGEADMNYLEKTLIPKSIEAAKESISNQKNALMAVSYSECFAGINRREFTDSESVILGQNPHGPYDPTMTAITFKTPKGNYIGTILHFATHPTSAGANHSITRDWPGYMIDRVESITNAPCMYVNGAEGDIGPRLSNGKTTADDSCIAEIGNIAADSAEKAILNAKDYHIPVLKINTENILLPYTEMPSLESVILDMEAMGDPQKLIEVDITTYDRLKKIKQIYEEGKDIPTSLVLKQTVFALDDLAVVPFPFETFCQIGISLDESSPYNKTLIFGLTCGSFGYLPTEEQIPYGGYEIDSFKAATIPGFIESLDKHIVKENVRLLRNMY